MAGLGRRTFQAGEVLTASNVMAYLQDQAVMNFAGTAARGSAIGTAVAEGMVSYLADNNFVQVHDGTAWRSIGGVQVASGTATRDALLPSPVQGDKVFRNDLGYEQTYYGAYGTANPGGRASAGWYDNQRNIGLVPIVAPNIYVSGGTATANTAGIVSFTNATSIELRNIFTTAYNRYVLNVTVTAWSNSPTSTSINGRFTKAGVNPSGYYYQSQYDNNNNANGAWTNGVNAAQFFMGDIGTGYNGVSYNSIFDIFNPQVAVGTSAFGRSAALTVSYFGHGIHSVHQNSSDTQDGFYLFPGAGNFTGKIACYAWNE